MIKSIFSSSPHLTVVGGNPATVYVGNNGGQGAGNVRYNTTNQYFEVYDGNSWIQLSASCYTTVGLFPNADAAIDWAIKKMEEEKRLEKLAETSPAIKDLLHQKQDIDRKIVMIEKLIQEEQTVGTN